MAEHISARSFEATRDSTFDNIVSKNEHLLVGLALILFILICISIQGRYIPWGDEVQFVDPAANLYYKLGFVSRQHSNQNDQTFWCGNVPGYSVLLYAAFVVFTFSQKVAWFLNVGIMVLSVLCLYTAVRRMN